MTVVEGEPPVQLEPATFAGRVYDSVGPLAVRDPEHGWALLILCNAIGQMFELVEELVRDTEDGPGWSVLVDVERCPEVALPWLAQFAGVRLPAGATEQQRRDLIVATDGFRRGTRAAMVNAAAATLTGAKQVVFRERNGAALGHPGNPDYAYYLTVNTYADQTPDPAATLSALLSQKPAGIVLDYNEVNGQDYQALKTGNATYNILKAKYPDYYAVVTDQPGV